MKEEARRRIGELFRDRLERMEKALENQEEGLEKLSRLLAEAGEDRTVSPRGESQEPAEGEVHFFRPEDSPLQELSQRMKWRRAIEKVPTEELLAEVARRVNNLLGLD